MSNERNYSSIYTIKDFAINDIAPKYLNMDNVNDLNVGLLGIVTDVMGTIAEDNFNTTTTYLNEIHPNTAILPETIYNNAALFQDSDFFAIPCQMKAWLFILEDNIIKDSTIVPNTESKEYFIDSDLKIDIEGIQFMLDYNIHISYIEYNNDYIFSVKYSNKRHGTDYKSPFNNAPASNGIIKSRRITYNNERYLAMFVDLRQVLKYVVEETVIGNNVINAPSFTIMVDGDISSFDVFCKEPGESNYTQLEKRLLGTPPEKGVKACYYRLTDENELEVSFTIKDGYYKPEFGASIIIDYTTTLADKGAFDLYNGSDIVCIGSSDIYDYNNKMIMFCIPQSASQFGSPKMTLEELRLRNCENFSTVKSYTIENDLQLYFNRFTFSDNVKMNVVKKRNDMYDRIFSTYILFRNSTSNMIKTNTLTMNLDAYYNDVTSEYHTGFDNFNYNDGDRYFPAGSLFAYGYNGTGIVYIGDDINNYDKYKDSYPFIFATPFLMHFETNPTTIGYYLNTINDTYPLDYSYVNNEEILQFMATSFKLSRDSVKGSSLMRNRYVLDLIMAPTVKIKEESLIDGDIAYTRVYGLNSNGEEVELGSYSIDSSFKTGSRCDIDIKLYFNTIGEGPQYIPCHISNYDSETGTFTVKAIINTDDYITQSEFRVTNTIDTNTGETVESKLIPMVESPLSITISLTNEDKTEINPVNTYCTMDTMHITFIKPLNMCKSDVTYRKASILNDMSESDANEYANLVDLSIFSVPMVGAETLYDYDNRIEFYNMYRKQYEYINDINENITNNYSLDIKFYNTYGKSKNYRVENGDLLDSVGIRIIFDIKSHYTDNTDILVRDIKIFIKQYIESINDSNTNAIYVSNLIKSIENQFDAVKYIKFGRKIHDKYIGIIGISEYGIETQTIENHTANLSELSYQERRDYVPEYLTIDLDDVDISLI